MTTAESSRLVELATNVLGFRDLLDRDELIISTAKRVEWQAHYDASAHSLAVLTLQLAETGHR